jgi:TP901 family phage tail tape measure protein
VKFGEASTIGKRLQGLKNDIAEVNKTLKNFGFTRNQINEAVTGIDKISNAMTQMGTKSEKSILKIHTGIKGYMQDVEGMFKMQLRWYGARFFSQAVLEAPFAAALGVIKYTAALDDARAAMLRWEATSGKVTAESISNVDNIMIQIRRALLEMPLTLDVASKSIQSFIGAGLSSGIVATMVPDILRLKNAFKEIDFEPFTIAVVGAFNVFKDQIGKGLTEAEKFRTIFEQLLRAQAKGVIRPEQFQKVFQYMAGIGEMSGMTLEQLLAISVALTDTGNLAANASRMFRTLLINIPQEKATAGFRAIGIELKKDIPLMHQFKTITDGIVKLVGKSGAIDVERLGFLGKIVAPEQLKALVDVARNWEKVGALTEDIKNATGGLLAASDVVSKPLGAQWQILLNTLNEIGKSLAESSKTDLNGFLATIVDVAKGLLFAADSTGKFADKLDKLGDAGKAAYAFFSEIGAFIGPFVESLGQLLKLFAGVTSFLLSFPGLIANVITAMIALATTLSGHPILGTFLAGMAALGATMRYLNSELDTLNRKDLSFDSFMQGASRAEISKRLEEMEKAKSSLLFANPALAGTKEIKDLEYKIARARKKLEPVLDTTKNPPPSPFTPPDTSKEFGMADLSAVKKTYNALLDAAENNRKSALKILADQYREGLLREEEYYQKRVNIAESSYEEENDLLIRKGRELRESRRMIISDIQKQYLNKGKDAEKTNKIAEVIKNFEAEEEALKTKRINLENKRDMELSDAKADLNVRLAEMARDRAKAERDVAENTAKVELDIQKGHLEALKNLRTDAYNEYKISAKDFYSFSEDAIDKNSEIEKKAIDDHIEALWREWREEKRIKEANKLLVNVLAAQRKADDDKRRIDETNKTTKAINDIQKMNDPRYLYESGGNWKKGFANVTEFGLNRIIGDFKNTGAQILQIWNDASKAMADSFQSFFVDAIEGKMQSLADYVNSFLKSVYTSIAAALGQQVSGSILSAVKIGVSTYMGTPEVVKHTGGKVVSYHGGGEVNAKLLVGERVLSREQSAMFESLSKNTNNPPEVVINVVNETGRPVTMTQQGAPKFELGKLVTSVVLSDLNSGGPISRRMGK